LTLSQLFTFEPVQMHPVRVLHVRQTALDQFGPERIYLCHFQAPLRLDERLLGVGGLFASCRFVVMAAVYYACELNGVLCFRQHLPLPMVAELALAKTLWIWASTVDDLMLARYGFPDIMEY
jgi:hypothetical protein